MEEIKEGTITEDQIKMVADALEESVTPGASVDKLRNVLDGNINTDPIVLEEQKEVIPIAPIVEQESKESKLLRNNNLTEEDALALFELSKTYVNDENVDVFEQLPERIRNIVAAEMVRYGIKGKKPKNTFAKMMVETLISEIRSDKEYEIFADELNKAMAIPDLIDMHFEHMREKMEVDLIKKAEDMEQLNKDKAEELKRISQAYTDSYTLVRMRDYVENNKLSLINKMNKNVTKRYQKFCEDFDYNMAKSQYRCPKIDLVVPALVQLFNVDEYTARRFVVILCKVSEKLDIHKKEDVWYMYHAVKTPIGLTHVHQNKTEFSKLILKNLKEFLEYMIELEAHELEV